MNPADTDRVMFKLQTVCEVYGHKLSKAAQQGWMDFFYDRDPDDCIRALADHMTEQDKRPKPIDIRNRLQALKSSRGAIFEGEYRGNDQETINALRSQYRESQAGSKIVSAWIVYHKLVYGGAPPIHGVKQKFDLTKEQAIEIVNEQAAKHRMPEAILPEYRIPHYWEESECLI